MPALLSPYRVLDLTDDRAALGPMLLGDLGAAVTRIVPPDASPAGIDRDGLATMIYNRGKQIVPLDLDDAAGREELRRLAAAADFLFENDAPGAMAARGLGFAALRALNPRLVYVAVTPFGQDGPYAQWAATDLTLAALGGMVGVNGDPDRAPVRVSVPQAWLHAAAESAAAAMIAHACMLSTGEAQFVDLSVQACLPLTMLQAGIATAIQGKDIERSATDVQLGTITLKVMYRCADGDIVLFINGPLLKKLVPWMVEDGVVPEAWLSDEDWGTYDVRLLTGQPLAHAFDDVMAAMEAFALRHSMTALFERGLEANAFLAPVNTVADVLAFDHLDARGYWQPLALPDGRTVRAPGAWVRVHEGVGS